MPSFFWRKNGVTYDYPLKTVANTTPAFHVRVGGQTLHADLELGSEPNMPAFQYGGNTYMFKHSPDIEAGTYDLMEFVLTLRGMIASGATRNLQSPVSSEIKLDTGTSQIRHRNITSLQHEDSSGTAYIKLFDPTEYQTSYASGGSGQIAWSSWKPISQSTSYTDHWVGSSLYTITLYDSIYFV